MQDDKPSEANDQVEDALSSGPYKRRCVEVSFEMREQPTKEPIQQYLESMLRKTGSDFTYAFIHAASRYDHKDVKSCEGMPSKLKSHLSS